MAASLLEASGLSKAYGARQALVSASLRVHEGEGVALLGPNGSGKTTLLCLLAGVLRPDEGSARLLGQPTKRPKGRRALAFVPQDGAIYDGLSARENVELFGRLHALSGARLQAAVGEALEAAALSSLAEVRAASMSGGMRRRVSLACALVHGPRLLLLDEPFEGVDHASRDHLLSVLRAAKARGVALLLSTHRSHEVSALCDRYLMMRDGRIVAERTVIEGAENDPMAEPPDDPRTFTSARAEEA